MPSFNKVMLIGRLTRDPELRYTSGGLAMVNFSIAVDRPFKDQQTGERKTDFFRCKAWRQKAEFVSNYVQKGRLVAVDGRIEMNEYVAQDGTKKYSTDIVADNVELLDGNRDGAGEAAPAGNFNGGASRGGQSDDGGYFPDEEAAPAPAPRRAAPPQPAAAAPRPAARPAAPAPAARPAARPAPAQPAYTDDDFDDSDPFADE
jgi:single-strand DNA-binding protein